MEPRVFPAALLIVSVVSFVVCIPIFLQPVFHDASIYAYAAERMLSGGTPYVDVWDIKSPGIFFQFAVEMAIGRTYSAVYAFDMLWVIAAAWMVRRALMSHFSEAAATLAAAALIVGFVALMHDYHMLQPEVASLFFAAWLLDIGLREQKPSVKEGIGAGIALAALFWLKLPFVLIGIVTLPRIFAHRREVIAPIGASLAAFAAIAGIVFAYFGSKGAIPALIEGAFTFPANVTSVQAYPIGERFSRLALGSFREFRLLLFVSLFAGLGCIAAVWKRSKVHLTIALLFVSDLVIIFVQGRFLAYHFDLLLLPLAILAGIGAAQVLSSFKNVVKPAVALAGICFLMLVPSLPIIKRLWVAYIDTGGNRQAFLMRVPSFYATETEVLSVGQVLELQAKLGRQTEPTDTILPFNLDPSFNMYSGRQSPTRFSYLWAMQDPRLEKSEWRDELTNAVLKEPPKYIVVSRINTRDHRDDLELLRSWPRLGEWFDLNYELVDVLGPIQTYLHKRN